MAALGASMEALVHRGGVKFAPKTLCDRFVEAIRKWGRRAPLAGVSLTSFGRVHGTLLALAYMLSILTAVGVQLWQRTELLVGQEFMSLNPRAPGTYCREVPLTLDGTFRASHDGYWDTDFRHFNPNKSTFVFEVHGGGFTTRQYKDQMRQIAADLGRLGRAAKSRNILSTLIYWASLNFRYPNVLFHSVADPGVIFDGQMRHSLLSSTNGICQPLDELKRQVGSSAPGSITSTLSAIFERSTKRLQLRLPVFRYTPRNSSSGKTGKLTPFQPCPGQGNWIDRVVNNNNRFSNNLAQFAIQHGELAFDVRTTLLAISLNLNLTSPGALQEVTSTFMEEIGLVGYIEPSLLPPMSPVYCLKKESAAAVYGISLTQQQFDGPPICMVADSFRTATVFYFYPHIVQLKPDNKTMWPWLFTRATPCKCPDDEANQECNGVQKFTFSFFYDMNFSRDATVKFAADMQQVVIGGGEQALEANLWKVPMLANNIKSNRDHNVRDRNDIPVTSFTDNRTGFFYDNSWAEGRSINQMLSAEFTRLCSGNCAAITFAMQKMMGQTDIAFAMNNYNLALGNLMPNTTDPMQYFHFTSLKLTSSQVQVAKDLNRIKMPFLMCKDTLSQAAALAKLEAQPPVPLIALYYKCRTTQENAMLSVFGSVVTSSFLYVSLAWIVFGAIYVRLIRASLPEGAILPTTYQMESIQQAESDVEKAKMVSFLEGLRLYIDDRASASDVKARIDALTRTLRVASEPSNEAIVTALGREITCRLDTSQESNLEPFAADFGDTRRVTLYPRASSFSGAPPRRSFSVRRSTMGLTAHPLEAVLSKTRPPSLLEQGRKGDNRL